MRPAQEGGDEVEHGPVGVAHPRDAIPQVDLRRERLRPVEPDRSAGHGLGLYIEIGRGLGPSGQRHEVAFREGYDFVGGHIADQHQRRVVGHEVVIVDPLHRGPREVAEVPEVPAVGLIDRVGCTGDPVDRLVEAGLWLAQSPEDLLQHGKALRLPAPEDRVGHAVRLEPEEELQMLPGERHVHLHVVLLGAGRHRIRMARVPAVLEVPLVGSPEVAVLVVQVLELVEPLPEGLHLGCARPTQLVEEHAPLPQLIALAVSAAR